MPIVAAAARKAVNAIRAKRDDRSPSATPTPGRLARRAALLLWFAGSRKKMTIIGNAHTQPIAPTATYLKRHPQVSIRMFVRNGIRAEKIIRPIA